MRSYRCGGFLPLFDPRDHLVAEAWDSRNVSGLLRVISKQAAERSHRLVNRVGGNRDTRPSLIEQLINADHLARTGRQGREEAAERGHRVGWFRPRGPSGQRQCQHASYRYAKLLFEASLERFQNQFRAFQNCFRTSGTSPAILTPCCTKVRGSLAGI